MQVVFERHTSTYSTAGDEALAINSGLHDQRIKTNGGTSPESQGTETFFSSRLYPLPLVQFDQVRLILDKLYPEYKAKQS